MATHRPSRKTSELKLVSKSVFLELVLLFVLASTEAIPVNLIHSSPLDNMKVQPYALSLHRGLEAIVLWNIGNLNENMSFQQRFLKPKKRRKRELRSSRKMLPSPMPIQMPAAAYFPFIMAEMLPGSVKTRHPALIAVNGCPAYYIADNTGQCRQMFQYTSIQRSFSGPSLSYFRPKDIFWAPKRIENFKSSPSTAFSHRNNQVETMEVPSASRYFAALLSNIPREPKHPELDKNKSNSVEITDSVFDKIREKILSLLKIKGGENLHYFRDSHNVVVTEPPPDYNE